jgi:hypothetical protein
MLALGSSGSLGKSYGRSPRGKISDDVDYRRLAVFDRGFRAFQCRCGSSLSSCVSSTAPAGTPARSLQLFHAFLFQNRSLTQEKWNRLEISRF